MLSGVFFQFFLYGRERMCYNKKELMLDFSRKGEMCYGYAEIYRPAGSRLDGDPHFLG